jgi:hypothetical protein
MVPENTSPAPSTARNCPAEKALFFSVHGRKSPGLRTHTTARDALANGKLSGPIPLAYGHACLKGENCVRGLIPVSEHSTPVMGMEFLSSGAKALISGSGGVILNEKDLMESMPLVAKGEAEPAAKRNQR